MHRCDDVVVSGSRDVTLGLETHGDQAVPTEGQQVLSSSTLSLSRPSSFEELTHRYTERPSCSAVETCEWSFARQLVFSALHVEVCGLPIFDLFMASVVIFNIVLIGLELNHRGACIMASGGKCTAEEWMQTAGNILFGIYLVECALRVFVQRRMYLRELSNCIDLLVLVLGAVQFGIDSVFENSGDIDFGIFRLIRIMRIVRALKIIRHMPTLWSIIAGATDAAVVMFWGFVFIMFLLMLWSLVALDLVHPIAWRIFQGHPAEVVCRNAFSSVLMSALYFFMTLVATSDLMTCAMPIIEDSPFTVLIFAAALFTIQLGFLNLLIAVIIDKASTSREEQSRVMSKEVTEKTSSAFQKWHTILKRMDQNEDGAICFTEFLRAYNADETVRVAMQSLGIHAHDLELMFDLMDVDGSEIVSYSEFVQSMLQCHRHDQRFSMLLVHLRLAKVEAGICRRLDTKIDEMNARMEEAIRIALQASVRAEPRADPASSPLSSEREDHFHEPALDHRDGRPGDVADESLCRSVATASLEFVAQSMPSDDDGVATLHQDMLERIKLASARAAGAASELLALLDDFSLGSQECGCREGSGHSGRHMRSRRVSRPPVVRHAQQHSSADDQSQLPDDQRAEASDGVTWLLGAGLRPDGGSPTDRRMAIERFSAHNTDARLMTL
mmetsp:Transcript_121087/g.349858  ORF Transcript_121087/g.349858 Transcript_121087/m.349858 type:complete len:670 (-) Transcript_121087:219-2228(-)